MKKETRKYIKRIAAFALIMAMIIGLGYSGVREKASAAKPSVTVTTPKINSAKISSGGKKLIVTLAKKPMARVNGKKENAGVKITASYKKSGKTETKKYTVSGSKIKKAKNANEYTCSVNISKLPAGAYITKVNVNAYYKASNKIKYGKAETKTPTYKNKADCYYVAKPTKKLIKQVRLNSEKDKNRLTVVINKNNAPKVYKKGKTVKTANVKKNTSYTIKYGKKTNNGKNSVNLSLDALTVPEKITLTVNASYEDSGVSKTSGAVNIKNVTVKKYNYVDTPDVDTNDANYKDKTVKIKIDGAPTVWVGGSKKSAEANFFVTLYDGKGKEIATKDGVRDKNGYMVIKNVNETPETADVYAYYKDKGGNVCSNTFKGIIIRNDNGVYSDKPDVKTAVRNDSGITVTLSRVPKAWDKGTEKNISGIKCSTDGGKSWNDMTKKSDTVYFLSSGKDEKLSESIRVQSWYGGNKDSGEVFSTDSEAKLKDERTPDSGGNGIEIAKAVINRASLDRITVTFNDFTDFSVYKSYSVEVFANGGWKAVDKQPELGNCCEFCIYPSDINACEKVRIKTVKDGKTGYSNEAEVEKNSVSEECQHPDAYTIEVEVCPGFDGIKLYATIDTCKRCFLINKYCVCSARQEVSADTSNFEKSKIDKKIQTIHYCPKCKDVIKK